MEVGSLNLKKWLKVAKFAVSPRPEKSFFTFRCSSQLSLDVWYNWMIGPLPGEACPGMGDKTSQVWWGHHLCSDAFLTTTLLSIIPWTCICRKLSSHQTSWIHLSVWTIPLAAETHLASHLFLHQTWVWSHFTLIWSTHLPLKFLVGKYSLQVKK